MKQFFILIFFSCFCSLAYSQHILKGTVTDAITHEALTGVVITSGNSTAASSVKTARSDNQGKFSISYSINNGLLQFSMIGYNSKQVAVPAAGQYLEVSMEPATLDLQPVIVSASREKQSRQDAPIAISKISSAQIQETKATAIYQLLNKVSGVNMVNLNSEQHMMAIRQPITTKALYLYMEDGLPIRPTGIFNHNSLYEINMAGVRDIEVIKGPASSLYGSNAIGGAINFISQGPPSGTAGQVSLQGDNRNYYRADASGGFTAGKFGVFTGGYITRQRNSWQDYSDFDKYSATINTTYDFNANTRLTTRVSYNYLNNQTPGSLDSAHFYSKSYNSNQEFAYRKVNAFRAATRLEHSWNTKSSSFITAFFRDNSTAQLPSYYISDVRDAQGKYLRSYGQENDQKFRSYGFLAQHRSDFDFLHSKFIVGAYLDNSPSSYNARYLNIQKDVTRNYYSSYTNTDSLIDDYRIRLFNTALYAQYEFKPAAPLRFVLGLRYDRVSYDFDNSLPPDRSKYKQQQKNAFNIVAPKAGFTYDLGNNKGFYGNFSVGFQPPETGDLYSSRQLAPVNQASFYNYEIGGWFSALHNRLYAELSVYDLEGRDEIISVLLPDNSTQNQNAGATRHQGVEYSLTYAPVKQLSLRISGTNARHMYIHFSEIRSSGGKNSTVTYDGNKMTNAPAWIANAEISYKPLFLTGLRASAEWQHIGPYYTNNANTKSYAGYNIYNLRLGYDLKKSILRGASVWFNILNVTNRLYATNVTSSTYGDTYYAAPPQTVAFGISYSFSK